MSIDQKQARQLLSELSTAKGGSIVGRVSKAELNPTSRILFIGLGGMGCKTVNAIKGVYKRKFKATPDVKFLAVDTAKNEIAELEIEHGGNLSRDECFEIYDENSAHLLIARPPIVENWISPNVPREVIDETGAKCRRAVGRVMLCGTNKYISLEATIRSMLQSFTNGTIEVVICSGISGGTGSGTFIDVSYMLRMMLDDLTRTFNRDTRLFGVFYTPDCQKSVPEIGGDPAKWAALQTNGYAAMKELNYFMNVGKQGYSDTVYHIELPDGTVKSTGLPIFDRGKVFIVSTTPQLDKCEDIICSVAESLMNVFRPGSVDATGQKQSTLSTLCNITSFIGHWENQRVNVDPMFPSFMNHQFSAIGSRSIYFPRNEMVAYCANAAFKEIIGTYKQAFRLSNNDIGYIADFCQLGSFDQILDGIKKMLLIDSDTFRIKKGQSQYYPVRKGLERIGFMEDLGPTVKEAKEIVERHIKNISGLDKCISVNVNAVKALIEGKKNFERGGRSFNFWDNYGPYGGIVLLTGCDGTDTHGIIDILVDMGNSLGEIIQKKNTAVNEKANALSAAQDTLQRDHSPTDEEIEVFIDACNDYSKAYFDALFVSKYGAQYLSFLVRNLNDYNLQTFKIYVPIIDAIADILSEDADAFAKGYLTVNNDKSVFSLNALNLDRAMERNDLFAKMFNGYLANSQMISTIKTELTHLLFAQEHREKWINFSNNPELLNDAIREVFSSITKPLVSSMLEKFIVLVYGNKEQIVELNNGNSTFDIDAVNQIWNDEELRNNALIEAATNIVNTLRDSALIAFELPSTEVAKYSRQITVQLLAETPNLNVCIQRVLSQRYGTNFSIQTIGNMTTCEYATEITISDSIYPFALDVIRNIRDYAIEYFKSEIGINNTGAGRHLDESTEMWSHYLPEIFGVDTERFYAEVLNRRNAGIPDDRRAKLNGKPVNHDREMYDSIREAVDFGIKNGYISVVNDGNSAFYELLKLDNTSADFILELEEMISNLKNRGKPCLWKDALREIEEEKHHRFSTSIRLDEAINNSPLLAGEMQPVDNDYDLKNIYRIVRADMKIEKCVIEAMTAYSSINFFHDIGNASEFDDMVSYYIRAQKCKMITYDKKKGYVCTYSDNPGDKPIFFFDDYLDKNELLDEPFNDYLVFSAFVKNALDKYVKESIDISYKELQRRKKRDGYVIPSCKDILERVTAGLESQLFAIRDPKIRSQKIELHLHGSEYKEYYDLPKKCDGDAEILVSNFNSFKDALMRLDETGIL